MESTFKFTEGGIEVCPTPRAKLPGLFMNMLQAERGLEKYELECRAAKANKKTRKAK